MRAPILCSTLAAALALAGAAHADTRVGLGAAASAEAEGLGADVDLGPVLVEATVAAQTATNQQGSSCTFVSGSVGALARLAHRDLVALYAGLRVDISHQDPSLAPGVLSISPTAAAPLRIQMDVTPWLSIDAEVALEVFRAGDVHGAQITPPSLGFTLWF